MIALIPDSTSETVPESVPPVELVVKFPGTVSDGGVTSPPAAGVTFVVIVYCVSKAGPNTTFTTHGQPSVAVIYVSGLTALSKAVSQLVNSVMS